MKRFPCSILINERELISSIYIDCCLTRKTWTVLFLEWVTDWLLCPNYRRETDTKGLRIPRYSGTKMGERGRDRRMKAWGRTEIAIRDYKKLFPSIHISAPQSAMERESHSSPSFVSILFFFLLWFSLSGMYCTFRFAIKGNKPLHSPVDLRCRTSTSRSSPALRAQDWWRRNPPYTWPKKI